MSTYETHEFSTEKFLTVACNILHKSLVESSRTAAKNVYKTLEEGKRVALIKLKMEDDTELRFDLSLDASEFRGKINFGAFRTSVQALIGSIAGQLEANKEITTFAEESSGQVLFGVPGMTRAGGEINVMMLASDTAAAVAHLKLQYMEPNQFLETAKSPA